MARSIWTFYFPHTSASFLKHAADESQHIQMSNSYLCFNQRDRHTSTSSSDLKVQAVFGHHKRLAEKAERYARGEKEISKMLLSEKRNLKTPQPRQHQRQWRIIYGSETLFVLNISHESFDISSRAESTKRCREMEPVPKAAFFKEWITEHTGTELALYNSSWCIESGLMWL